MTESNTTILDYAVAMAKGWSGNTARSCCMTFLTSPDSLTLTAVTLQKKKVNEDKVFWNSCITNRKDYNLPVVDYNEL